MLRRAVFALVLVGAAFGGGAAINGPGLAWLKQNFAGGPTIIVDGPPAPAPSPKGPLKQFPTASTPPLQLDIRRAPAAIPRKTVARPAELAQADPPLLPESPSTPASDLAPLPGASTPAGEPPALASAVPAASPPGLAPSTPESASLPTIDPSPPPKADPVARLASVESPSPSPSPPSPSKDWADLRKRMKALGIGRYTIEGETDGRVRFSCVIPVDGLHAVGHHFEADGDDEYQAAEAALRRIALWKATTPND